MRSEAIGYESLAPDRRRDVNESNMSKADIPQEVNFQGGRRGLHATRYASGTNMIALEPDVARTFKTAEQVNRVLRTFIAAAAEIAPVKRPVTPKSSGRRASRRNIA